MALDKYPQRLRFQITEETVNTFTEKEYPTTVIHNMVGGKSYVMEMLKVILKMSYPEPIAKKAVSVFSQVTSKPMGGISEVHTPGVIVRFAMGEESFGTELSGNITHQTNVQVTDLSDGNGRGELYGKNSIWVGIKGSENINPRAVSGYILYRLVQVSPTELIPLMA